MKARQAEPKVRCDQRMEAKTEPCWRLDRSERRCWKAFTLIELMVVIAVIAVIAALLFPALSQGRASAQRITCLNNLRQLALATQMYWDENADMTFRYRGAATNGGVVWWFGWLEQWNGANEGARAFDVTLGALYPYLQGPGVESCPALDHSFRRFKLKATGAAYGYGYNRHLSGVSTSKIARPTDLVLFVD